MEKWVVTMKNGNFKEVAEKFGIDPVIARILRNRDLTGDGEISDYLYGTMDSLPSPWLLKDMDRAVSVLTEKIREKKKIRIIGDYDIDGVMSTYVLLKGLTLLGADADHYIPDRIADGYGLHIPIMEKAVKDGIDTILTCDNGIAAHDEIRYAKEQGMTVVVTDHHEVPYVEEHGEKTYLLPEADAVVDPKRPDCSYPSKNICGAVVAYKLIRALYERSGTAVGETDAFIEFIGIATVGDVMDLTGESRTIVKEALKRIPYTENTGLKALVDVCGLRDKKITAYHIGFVLGPCINASGRIDTAERALGLFLSEDSETAYKTAGDLENLNQSRKAMTEKGAGAAYEMVEKSEIGNDRVLVIYLPECHESLAGIIAGRIRERYNKPAFVLTDGEQSVKGSGRSIEAYSMYDELVKCADLLLQFGGHPMAAGLSIAKEKIPLFRKRLNDNCTLTEEELIPRVTIDVPMPFGYVTESLTRQLSLLEPFGKGNPRPLFAQKEVHAGDFRVYGQNRNVLRMNVRGADGHTCAAVYFGDADALIRYSEQRQTISVTYYPEINTYRGVDSIRLVVQNYC